MTAEHRRIVVLGHRGMLGHVAVRYFRERGFEVSTVERRYDPEDPAAFIGAVTDAKPDVVLNAIGLVKQRVTLSGELMNINAGLPFRLRLGLGPEVLLIHPSTDCVFAGDSGPRNVSERPNATDAYGLSKGLGERVAEYPNTVVVRCSIVGPERGDSPRGLLGWFLSQPNGAELRGYTNHLWNGITTLEWCEVAHEILLGLHPESLLQPGTAEIHSKAQMLRMFAKVFQRSVRIVDRGTSEAVDRSLLPTDLRKPLATQLDELAYWMRAGGYSVGGAADGVSQGPSDRPACTT